MRNAIATFLFLGACCLGCLGQDFPSPPQPHSFYDGLPEHKFLDGHNVVLLGAIGASISADLYTTRRNLSSPNPGTELNPLARPFVQSNKGAVLVGAASAGGAVALMGVLHHFHRHRAERIVGWLTVGAESSAAAINSLPARR